MDDDYMDDEDYVALEQYLDMGVIEVVGVDNNGELIFVINETAKDLAPELWQAHSEYVDNTLMEMYKKDLIDIEYNEDLEATIHMSKEGYNFAKERGILPIEGLEDEES